MAIEDSVENAYQAFYNFARACYEFLGQYIDNMLQFIVPHIRARDDKTIFALQLLDEIGD